MRFHIAAYGALFAINNITAGIEIPTVAALESPCAETKSIELRAKRVLYYLVLYFGSMVNRSNIGGVYGGLDPVETRERRRQQTLLYCTVLYCTVLYCTVLYCTVLYCTVLYCTVLYCNVLYCTVLYCTVLYCTVLYCTVLYCTVLYCTVLYCTVLYCTVLYCTVLYCTVLYCTVLYCTAAFGAPWLKPTHMGTSRTCVCTRPAGTVTNGTASRTQMGPLTTFIPFKRNKERFK